MEHNEPATEYGYVNCAYFNRRPEGDTIWSESREERNAALKESRARSVAAGLSPGSAIAGMCPVKRTVGGVR